MHVELNNVDEKHSRLLMKRFMWKKTVGGFYLSLWRAFLTLDGFNLCKIDEALISKDLDALNKF